MAVKGAAKAPATRDAVLDVLDGLDPKRCLYLVKPLTFQNLVEMAKQINNFWLSLANPGQKP